MTLAKKPIKITEVVLRDAHQSLLSTRLRTRDMLKGADGTAGADAACHRGRHGLQQSGADGPVF